MTAAPAARKIVVDLTSPDLTDPSFSDSVKVLAASATCPVCKAAFGTPNGMRSHLRDKGDAKHTEWRASPTNQKLLRAAMILGGGHNIAAQTPEEVALLSPQQILQQQKQQQKQQREAASSSGRRRLKLQAQREKEDAAARVRVDQLEAEVKVALAVLRGDDEKGHNAATAKFREWIPAKLFIDGRPSGGPMDRNIGMPTLSELKRGGFDAADCFRSRYSIKAMREAGYTAAEVSDAAPRRTPASDFCAELLGPKATRGSSGWPTDDGYYTWSEVAAAGYSEGELEAVLDKLLVTQLKAALECRGHDTKGLKKELIARMLQPERAKRKASELEAERALHDEEQMQDVQAAGLADEVAGLRAQLAAETQARQQAEQAQEASAELAAKRARLEPSGPDEVAGLRAQLEEAQEEMRAAKRARLEQSGREKAAVAWRDAAGAGVHEVVDEEDFMARYLAVRQYVEFMLQVLPSKTTRSKPWQLCVRREALCDDVIHHFSHGYTKQKLFQSTRVTFVNVHGEEEEGEDQGGLTVELYSSFFREVLLRDLDLFEGIADDAGGGSIGLLPKPKASPDKLKAVGRAMCKCVFDDLPIGNGIGCFLSEFLVNAHERHVFRTPQMALAALADFDPELAQRWRRLLAEPQVGLTLEMFDESVDDDDELPATPEVFGRAIVSGCRYRLLSSREASLRAVRDGFTEHVDLCYQLGALSSAELRLMLRGRTRLSAADLLGCFRMPDASLEAQATAGFAAAGSDVPRFMRELILDESLETGIAEEKRLHVLEWATALTALPCNGLKDPITLKLFEDRDDSDLPNVHTCTAEVHLPAYSSRTVLRAKLLQAVEHRHDGFNIE